jgi:hypothetical protein
MAAFPFLYFMHDTWWWQQNLNGPHKHLAFCQNFSDFLFQIHGNFVAILLEEKLIKNMSKIFQESQSNFRSFPTFKLNLTFNHFRRKTTEIFMKKCESFWKVSGKFSFLVEKSVEYSGSWFDWKNMNCSNQQFFGIR